MLLDNKKDQELDFFKAALKADKEIEIRDGEVERFEYSLKSPTIYREILGDLIDILEVKIRDEIGVISSPEAESIAGAGCVELVKGKEVFKLPRNHFGVKAQMDMEVAMWQLAQSQTLKKIVMESKVENSGIVYFAREGGITQWQKAVYLSSGVSLPTTLVCIHHTKAENSFSRIAEVVNGVNLEGFPLDNLENLYLCDPVASGMQQVAMIEKLLTMGAKPRRVIVIAPMGTNFGLKTVSIFCKSKGIEFKAGVCASLLDNVLPLRYFSPYSRDDKQCADLEIKRAVAEVFGENLHKFCIRCNWTGSFWASEELALNDSDKELKDLDLCRKELEEKEEEFMGYLVKKEGIKDKLLPYSTRAEML